MSIKVPSSFPGKSILFIVYHRPLPKIQSSKGAFEVSLKGSCCVFKIEYSLLEQADSTELRAHPRAAEMRIYSYGYRSSDFTLSDFERDWVENDNPSAELPGISNSCRSTTPSLPIVDSQQCPSSPH